MNDRPLIGIGVLICTAEGAQGQVTPTLVDDKSVQIREHVILLEKILASMKGKRKYIVYLEKLFTRHGINTMEELKKISPVSPSSEPFFAQVFQQQRKGQWYKKASRWFYISRLNLF
jgi:hypothetical protein